MVSRVVRSLPAAALALALAGCSDDEPSGGPGVATPPTTPSTTSAAPATPSVTPASGQEISNDTVSMRLTDDPDWQVARFSTTVTGGLLREDGSMSASVSDIRSTGDDELDSLAAAAEKTWSDDDPAPLRVANREIDGVDCYVLEASNDDRRRYIVGGDHDGFTFSIDFKVPVAWTDGDQLIEEMLASVDIRDH
ncbi:hypothetical protein GCM10009788_02480 [Nocardioides humi]|uniref:Lipoprotein LpqN n=1 Tax=Nocardioides humi TaxID=449461 RepID=A0ABN1ZRP0_9ACTN